MLPSGSVAHLEEPLAMVTTLSDRRARLRRRRRRDSFREWATLAALVSVGVWLAVIALVTMMAH